MMALRLRTLLGIGLLSMSVLMYEISLTRIFSVTLWYHFAFLVISLALLGSGAAGVWLFLGRYRLTSERVPRLLPWLAVGYALANLAAYLIYQQVPLTTEGLQDGLSAVESRWLIFVYAEFTVPFIFAGAAIALVLQHYQQHAGQMYFGDLVGASLGCVAAVIAIHELGGAGAILLTIVLGLASAALMLPPQAGTLTKAIIGGTCVLGVVGMVAQIADPWLGLRVRSTYNGQEPIYEAWNAHSRITVYDADWWQIPFGWGISQTYFDGDINHPGHKIIIIDEKAGTPIQRHFWNGGDEDWEQVDFLDYDLTSLPYYLYEDSEVFIIGPGGGRDVLTALKFGADQITGVELNGIITDLIIYDYADYVGHIYSRPEVDIHVDDARTFLAASDDRYDIIQASLIDTFAASSAGAFALSENGIYTVEAFEEYYQHLNEDGLVNFSRWYYAAGPAETLRLVSVGLQAWENQGIEDPTQHLVVIANPTPDRTLTEGLAGMLLKKTPFTPAELDRLTQLANDLAFEILYAPGISEVDCSPVAEFVLARDRQAFIDAYPLDISPSTDNRPFFFSVVRLGDLGKSEFLDSSIYGFGAASTRTLTTTLGVSVVLAFLLIVLPLILTQGRGLSAYPRGSAYILYYACLGLGFIMVEIPILQKLNIYMGNPTYALAIALFAILLFSGIGSLLSQSVARPRLLGNLRVGVAVLIVVVLLYILALPQILRATQGLPLWGRAGLVIVMLAPAGLLMGRPFPLGLRYVDAVGARGIMPWLWAANGMLSVVGSVSATILAIQFGFTWAFAVGLCAYVLALLATFGFGQVSGAS